VRRAAERRLLSEYMIAPLFEKFVGRVEFAQLFTGYVFSSKTVIFLLKTRIRIILYIKYGLF
jgi:hypothetical protein